MLNFLECDPKHKDLLIQLFTYLLHLQETEPQTVETFISPATLGEIRQLSGTAPFHDLLFKICIELCQINTLSLDHLPILKGFLTSDLMQMLNKLIHSNMLDIHAFMALVNEGDIKSLSKIFEILAENEYQIDTSLVLEICAILKSHQSESPDATKAILTFLQSIKDLKLLNTKRISLILKHSPKYLNKIKELCIDETKLINKVIGKHYLEQILDLHHAKLLDKIFHICIPVFNTDKSLKLRFMSMVLNYPKFCTDYLNDVIVCLNILSTRTDLNPNRVCAIVKTEFLPEVKKILIQINQLPPSSFSQSAPELLLENIHPININLFKATFSHKLFNGNADAIKLKFFKAILQIHTNTNMRVFANEELFIGMTKLEEMFIDIMKLLNTHKVLSSLEDDKLFEEFVFYNKRAITTHELMKGLELLIQAGLVTNKLTLSQFLKLLNISKTGTPLMQAQAFIELQQHPIHFSNEKSLKVSFKDIIYDELPLELLTILRKLETLKLLTPENLKQLHKVNKKSLLALKTLFLNDDLNSEHLKTIFEISNIPYIPKAPLIVLGLDHLKANGLLTEEFKANMLPKILHHTHPEDLCKALVLIHQSSIPEDKKQTYMQRCFSFGAQILIADSKTKAPDKLSAEELAMFKKAYVVKAYQIYSIDNGAIINQMEVSRITARQLKQTTDDFDYEKYIYDYELLIDAEQKKEPFVLDEKKLNEFLRISEVPHRFHLCTSYAKCILELESASLMEPWFTKSILSKVLESLNPVEIAQAFALLKKNQMFNPKHQTYREVLLSHDKPLSLAQALLFNREHQIIATDKIILEHAEPFDFINGMHQLTECGILKHPLFKDFIDIFNAHPNPREFVACLIKLQEEELLLNLLGMKKIAASLKQANFDLPLFTQAILRLNRQQKLEPEIIVNLKVFFNQTRDDFYEPFKKSLIEQLINEQQDLNVISKDILEKIKELKIYSRNYQQKLIENLAQLLTLLQNENTKPFSIEFIEILLKHHEKASTILENIKFLSNKKLINKEHIAIILELSTCSLRNYPNQGIFHFLESHEFNILECFEKMHHSPEIPHLISKMFVSDDIIKRNEHIEHDNCDELFVSLFKFILNGQSKPQHPDAFISTIFMLQSCSLLNADTLNKVINITPACHTFLRVVKLNNLLDPITFCNIIQFNERFTDIMVADLLRIPLNGLNAQHVGMILNILHLNILRRTNPHPNIFDYVNHTILGIPRPALGMAPQQNLGLNSRQSTHRKSVHESVSVSIKNLAARYLASLDSSAIQKSLHEIQAFLKTLESSPKYDAAKRFFILLNKHHDFYLKFIDPISKVSVLQLLHLFWVAVQDLEVRSFDPKEAPEEVIQNGKLLLVQALYEAMRDGNINSDGIDDQVAVDKQPSCPSGFVNKLIEKLVGVHPDAEIKIICLEVANEKIKAIVCEKAINATRLKIQAAKEHGEILADDEITDAVSKTWDTIKDEVGEVFFEEFKSLFNNQKDSPKFLELVDAGQYAELSTRQIEQLQKLNQQESRKRHADETEDACEATQASTSQLGLFQHPDVKPMDEEPDAEVMAEENTLFAKR